MVKGDQSRPDNGKAVSLENVVFENNLYLRASNWPAAVQIHDQSPMVGDPGFPNPGGLTLADYVPRNARQVKGKGIRIPKIPHDEIGLAVGLAVDKDILGTPIFGRPDMGAIQMP